MSLPVVALCSNHVLSVNYSKMLSSIQEWWIRFAPCDQAELVTREEFVLAFADSDSMPWWEQDWVDYPWFVSCFTVRPTVSSFIYLIHALIPHTHTASCLCTWRVFSPIAQPFPLASVVTQRSSYQSKLKCANALVFFVVSSPSMQIHVACQRWDDHW